VSIRWLLHSLLVVLLHLFSDDSLILILILILILGTRHAWPLAVNDARSSIQRGWLLVGYLCCRLSNGHPLPPCTRTSHGVSMTVVSVLPKGVLFFILVLPPFAFTCTFACTFAFAFAKHSDSDSHSIYTYSTCNSIPFYSLSFAVDSIRRTRPSRPPSRP
jgi:hypothetical protein